MKGLHYFFYLLTALSGILLFSWGWHGQPAASAEASLVDRGRQVYISEGCIHCHSQYVRPVGEDVVLWGERTSVERALAQQPVLIGNRRQGPDLANVGLRRNAGWNRLHLMEPSAVVPGSRMPSYRHLFEGGHTEGEALLAYLDSLQPTLFNADKEAAVVSMDTSL